MSKRQTFLILIILFSLLFVALIALGSYWLSLKTLPERQFGIAAFCLHLRRRLGKLAAWRCTFATSRVKKHNGK